MSFGAVQAPLYGTHGEFSVGSSSEKIRAKYILTKIMPGSSGSWESVLASNMVPWREVFKVEELSFDELIQRDLDDSRVAHELIPYLLSSKQHNARFFPPILAVVVPKKVNESGIEKYYPAVSALPEGEKFGDLFSFQKMVFDGAVSPLAELKYNSQKTAFIIVDGQHRAMAALAIHRQLNPGSWKGNPFESYYSHIKVHPSQVGNIELPVCLVYFPDIWEGNSSYPETVDLVKLCRDLFLVVNKQAKPVSSSRELLLDDVDFAAKMMRSTLSRLKNNTEGAKIYSFSFGDSDAEQGKAVVSGRLEYSSAVALHKIHAAASFAKPEAYTSLTDHSDITDGRSLKNGGRPIQILTGTPVASQYPSIGRWSCNELSQKDSEEIASKLGGITDSAIFNLFNHFRPFSVHNLEMIALKARLEDVNIKTDPIQNKCGTLLFEGSGVKGIFEVHFDRLKERLKENLFASDEERTLTQGQLSFCSEVMTALITHEKEFRKRRSLAFFYFDDIQDEEVIREVMGRAKVIFDTVSTQAFQLGYLMTVLYLVERALIERPALDNYQSRAKLVDRFSWFLVSVLNAYFSEKNPSKHHTLNGLIIDSRSRVFDQSSRGLRGLLHESVSEINEKQWPFFRYLILEVVHSKYVDNEYRALLNDIDAEVRDCLYAAISVSAEDIKSLRKKYVDDAINRAIRSSSQDESVLIARLQGEGKTIDQIQEAADAFRAERANEARERCKQHLRASLGYEGADSDRIAKLFQTS